MKNLRARVKTNFLGGTIDKEFALDNVKIVWGDREDEKEMSLSDFICDLDERMCELEDKLEDFDGD